jgi:hypothetical protein
MCNISIIILKMTGFQKDTSIENNNSYILRNNTRQFNLSTVPFGVAF